MEIDEIVQQKNDNQFKEQERKALASDIGLHLDSSLKNLGSQNQQQNQILHKGLISAFQIISEIRNENSQEIQDSLKKLEGILTSLIEKISNIKVEVPDVIVPEIKLPHFPEIKIPEIKLPTINIPKADTPIIPTPKVTVNIPQIKVPQPKVIVRPNITVVAPKEEIRSNLIEEKELYKEGLLDGWEKKYDNGKIVKMTGASVGKRKYEYR